MVYVHRFLAALFGLRAGLVAGPIHRAWCLRPFDGDNTSAAGLRRAEAAPAAQAGGPA